MQVLQALAALELDKAGLVIHITDVESQAEKWEHKWEGLSKELRMSKGEASDLRRRCAEEADRSLQLTRANKELEKV